MYFNSPLRYPGGKGKLAKFVRLVFQQNGLLDCHYVEPFAGGAGIALALLFDEYVSYIHINDLNKSIYAFWYSVLNETDALCDRILNTKVTLEEWHRQRYIQRHPQKVSQIDLAFSTFFMNRTNRSGIIKGGLIGGKKQNGKWKLDARFNKENLVLRIKRIVRYRSRISIYNYDAAYFIRKILSTLPSSTLVYLDPPYYKKGQELYENFYEHNDHVEIANLVSELDKKWIVSYDNTPEILHLYDGFKNLIYSLSYSAAIRYKGSEIMFFCDNLDIPNIENPAKIKSNYINSF
ncbi:MAG: DNA adenine methylase [Candidatus Thorarchaeota archaeon]